MMPDTKLKLCPFCGGEPKKWFWLESEKWAYISIQCEKCKAEIETRKSFSCASANNPGNAFIEAEKNAVEAWNRRI